MVFVAQIHNLDFSLSPDLISALWTRPLLGFTTLRSLSVGRRSTLNNLKPVCRT